MTLQQLRYIVAIDRFRNFARAADACDISQPTLSAMLIKLEEELDVRIFERTNKSVKPTIEGEKSFYRRKSTDGGWTNHRDCERGKRLNRRVAYIVGGSHHRSLSATQIHQALSHGIPFGVALHT